MSGPRTKKLTGRVFADRPAHRPLRIEALEQRQLLSAVAWSGGGNNSNWDNPQNWSTGNVPGPGDDVTISTAAAATIDIQPTDAESINSLTTASNDALSINGGSLSVAASSTLNGALSIDQGSLSVAASSTFTGGLSMTNVSSLVASGTGVNVTVSGSTTLSDSDLWAEAGATLSLPNLASYAAPGPNSFDILEATGTGSTLTLANLTGVTVGTYSNFNVYAQAGGTVNLPALAELNTGQVTLLCDGAGSLLNIPSLTDFLWASGSAGSSLLQASSGGTVQDGSLSSLAGVKLFLDGASSMSTGQITSYTNGDFTVNGGTFTFGALANLDESTVTVEGGATVSLPALTGFSNGSSNTLGATGTGSTLTLANLTAVTAAPSRSTSLSFNATSGGTVRLPALAQANGGGLFLGSSGTGSLLDASALTSLRDESVAAYTGGEIDLTNLVSVQDTPLYEDANSTILDGNLKTLSGITLTLDGTGPQEANSWTSFTDGDLTITGGSYNLPGLTDIDGSNLSVESGGSLALPGLTS
jgi:hypothetical protein